jgi:hypothetical protein
VQVAPRAAQVMFRNGDYAHRRSPNKSGYAAPAAVLSKRLSSTKPRTQFVRVLVWGKEGEVGRYQEIGPLSCDELRGVLFMLFIKSYAALGD